MPRRKAGRQGSVLERLKGMYPDLTASEQMITDFIIRNVNEIHTLTVTEMAIRCGVSEATITRFAKRCGMSGFTELRTAFVPDLLQWQQARYQKGAREEINPADPLHRVAEKFTDRLVQSWERAMASLDMDALEQAVDRLNDASRVVVFGNGGSAYLASSFALKLMKLGVHARAEFDPNTIETSLVLLGEDDVAFAISHGGESSETVSMTALARGRGCTTIGLTSSFQSPLARQSDVRLVYGWFDFPLGRATEIGLARTIQAGVIDLLGMGLALRMTDPQKPPTGATDGRDEAVEGGLNEAEDGPY